MIDQITADDIERLADAEGNHMISIYLPMEKASDTIQQNPIRLKNALQEVGQELEARGLETNDINSLLREASNLVPDNPFWQHQSDGLALFISPEGTETYRLPIPFDTVININDRFYVKPLLRMLSGDGRFYVLALAQNEVRLLRGSRYSVEEIHLEDEDLPENLDTMLRQLDIGGWRQALFRPESTISGHGDISMSTGRGGSQAIHSASYGVEEEKKQRILEFFRLVDRAVREIIEGEDAPLVTAGVEYLNPIYEEANKYRHLLPEYVTGNPEQWSKEELHEKAWGIVAPRFEQAQEKDANDYNIMKPRGQAIGDVAEIVPAAAFERVDTLWVSAGEQVWGTFDPQSSVLSFDNERQPTSYDLLDYAAVQTLANSGKVYVVEPGQVPGGGVAAALLRY